MFVAPGEKHTCTAVTDGQWGKEIAKKNSILMVSIIFDTHFIDSKHFQVLHLSEDFSVDFLKKFPQKRKALATSGFAS